MAEVTKQGAKSSGLGLLPRSLMPKKAAKPISKMTAMKAKLAKLHTLRQESVVQNHREVVEDDRQKKIPKNFEKKRDRLEREVEEEKQREQAEKEGKDYDRLRNLHVGADDAEKWERKKKKKNPDVGFSGYEAQTIRQYNRLINNKKVDLVDYERSREKMGDAAFYIEGNTVAIGLHKDSKESIDAMCDDLQQQIDKKAKFSRRRTHDCDADVNYINERNMKFNAKLSRFFDAYTGEIKANLERGTAV